MFVFSRKYVMTATESLIDARSDDDDTHHRLMYSAANSDNRTVNRTFVEASMIENVTDWRIPWMTETYIQILYNHCSLCCSVRNT